MWGKNKAFLHRAGRNVLEHIMSQVSLHAVAQNLRYCYSGGTRDFETVPELASLQQ